MTSEMYAKMKEDRLTREGGIGEAWEKRNLAATPYEPQRHGTMERRMAF